MSIVHLKRYRMQLALPRPEPLIAVPLPPGYRALPWNPRLLDMHAAAKHASFHNELDAVVFPSLATVPSCLQLMRDISGQVNFVPAATWLVVYQPDERRPSTPVATIQGMRDPDGVGSIQNVGVAPGHRGKGLGTQLLSRAIEGFARTGHHAVSLEVTAKNTAAIRLYERLGFRTIRVVYRSIQLTAPTVA